MKYALFLVFSQVAIATSAIFARFSLPSTGPLTLSALRLTIASIVLLIGMGWLGRRHRLERDLGRVDLPMEMLLACAGTALGAHFAAWMASLNDIPIALSTLLVVMTPIWNAAYEKFVLRRRMTTLFWAALWLAVVGLYIVTFGPRIPLTIFDEAAPGFLRGVLLALSGGILMSFYMAVVEYVGGERSRGSRYSTSRIITRTYPWAAVFLTLAAASCAEPFPSIDDHMAWFGVLGLALIPQLIGHTLLNVSIRQLKPSLVAFASLLEPLLSGVLAYFVFSEELTPHVFVGGAVILIALGLALFASKNQFDI